MFIFTSYVIIEKRISDKKRFSLSSKFFKENDIFARRKIDSVRFLRFKIDSATSTVRFTCPFPDADGRCIALRLGGSCVMLRNA